MRYAELYQFLQHVMYFQSKAPPSLRVEASFGGLPGRARGEGEPAIGLEGPCICKTQRKTAFRLLCL